MDRYLIRMNESLESVKTISAVIKRCERWNLRTMQNLAVTNMESMIHYFKLVSEGYTFYTTETQIRQEAPKGELGCQVLSGIISRFKNNWLNFEIPYETTNRLPEVGQFNAQ